MDRDAASSSTSSADASDADVPSTDASPNDISSPDAPSTPFDLSDKIYEVAFAEPTDRLEAYADLVAIVKQLRRDCPWDREQTHESVKHLLIEEAYEVVDAIEDGDPKALAEELGDVLLHVLFHSTIAEESGTFTVQDVIEAERDKLVRRHPHVFGDAAGASGTAEASDAEAVAASWEEIKQQERAENGEDEGAASVLDGVPSHLPALLRAERTQEKAAGVGFAFRDDEDAWAQVEEELDEFRVAVQEGSAAEREEELGDLLFALVNYARFQDLSAEDALRATTNKFTDRFQYVERQLDARGDAWGDVSLDEARRLWDEAKAASEAT
jgi:XTP/dITP diphosphohydrolase/tetrapyrrole methylase family protein/MazG family protein